MPQLLDRVRTAPTVDQTSSLLAALEARAVVLARELEEVGARLGTSHERPGDLELAQKLGHDLRNSLGGVMPIGFALPHSRRYLRE
jgi:hypothetical protein